MTLAPFLWIRRQEWDANCNRFRTKTHFKINTVNEARMKGKENEQAINNKTTIYALPTPTKAGKKTGGTNFFLHERCKFVRNTHLTLIF